MHRCCYANEGLFFGTFLKFAVFSAVFAESTLVLCPRPNEYYESCGHACGLTCDNYKNPPACIAMCQPELAGCYCKNSYVRNKKGDCILREQCCEGNILRYFIS